MARLNWQAMKQVSSIQGKGGVIIAPFVLHRTLVVPAVHFARILKHKSAEENNLKHCNLSVLMSRFEFTWSQPCNSQTYRDGQDSIELVDLALSRLHPWMDSLRLLDEVSIAQPTDFRGWIGMDMGLQNEHTRIGLLQFGLLIDLGRDVLLVVRWTTEIQGQSAILLSHGISGPNNVVTAICSRGVLEMETTRRTLYL